MSVAPNELIHTLTGCTPGAVASTCTLEDLQLLRQLVEEALEIKEGPLLRVVGGR